MPQLSVAETVATATVAPHLPLSLFTLMLTGQVMEGGILSTTLTTTGKVQEDVKPLISVAVAITLVLPTGKKEPGGML